MDASGARQSCSPEGLAKEPTMAALARPQTAA